MKRLLAFAILFFVGIVAKTQNYPSEWLKYTSDGYFHDIESAEIKQDAIDLARLNLARQIQVVVKDTGQIDKSVVNGISNIYYTSQTSFLTDLVLKLSETQSHYDKTTNKHYVIAYINKHNARTFYENDVKMLISDINNVISVADNYIKTGFKSKAKTELDNSSGLFDDAKKSLFWLNVLDLEEYELQQYINQINILEQTVKLMSANLEYGTTYCIVCNADNFGKRYSTLENEIKGDLSASSCNFVNDPSQADYVIYINASAREYNAVSYPSVTAYFTYIDATISIDKVATKQRIYRDEMTVKGSHTANYEEAGRDGYRKISKEISKIINDNIKL